MYAECVFCILFVMSSFLHLIPDLQTLGYTGYLLVFLVTFGESLVFTGMFVPGTVFIVIAGGMAAHGYYSFWVLVAVSSLASYIGDAVSYECGRRGQVHLERRPFLRKHVERARPFFKRHQGKSIILGRFIGFTRPVIPFLAGVADMKRSSYYLISMISGSLWSFCYVGVGYVFGAAWKVALLWSSRIFLFLIVVAVCIFLLLWLWRWIIAKGRPYFLVIGQGVRKMWRIFLSLPFIARWIRRHHFLLRFLANRFHLQSFVGLPLTGLVIACLTSLGLFLGIAEDYLTGDPITFLDVRLENLLYIFRSDILLDFFRGVMILGDWRAILFSASILSIVFLVRSKKIYAATLWLNILCSQSIVLVSIFLFHRPRPAGLLPAIIEESYSFPSSHATIAAAFYGFLAYTWIRSCSLWKSNVSALFIVFSVIFLIDFSELYFGVHYLSDVLAGNFVGFMTLFFSISVCEWLFWRWNIKWGKPRQAWETLIAVILCSAVAIAFAFIAHPPRWNPNLSARQSIQIRTSDVPHLFLNDTLPRYTTSLPGRPQEPISFIFVGTKSCLIQAFDAARWKQADQISLETAGKLAKTAFLNQEFPSAPITPYFYNTFPHDLGFEKETPLHTIRSRHHARVWETSYDTPDGSVFVATASFDTHLKWAITHSIAPDIDTERDLLVSNLRQAGVIRTLREFALVPAQSGHNFTGDTFFTDGKAEFIVLKPCSAR